MEDNLSHAISKLPYYCSSEQKRSDKSQMQETAYLWERG